MGCTIDDADDASNAVYYGQDTGGNAGAGRDFIPTVGVRILGAAPRFSRKHTKNAVFIAL